jgi:hypothetical protein
MVTIFARFDGFSDQQLHRFLTKKVARMKISLGGNNA